MLTPTSPLLTSILTGVTPKPQHLYVRGNNLDNILQLPRLTVVGSRKPTTYGKSVTQSLVSAAGELGIAIVSGLALGIDAIAHQAALSVHTPTIAILPGGVHTVAPATNQKLAEHIIEQSGVLISEYAEGAPIYKTNFVARDRLMAAFGDAVLVTEAAEKSGTLHTAAFALDIGKPVLAVPGPITSPLSFGTNNLIKSGAIAVTCIEDILLAMGLQKTKLRARKPDTFTPEEYAVIALLQQGISDGASLALQSRLSAAQFNQALTMLEISGRITSVGGDQWLLI
jgi:DNA processing protein